ncbi:hypothetical protein WDW89_22305 [Deltaproteobacteria bacterium TL4]
MMTLRWNKLICVLIYLGTGLFSSISGAETTTFRSGLEIRNDISQHANTPRNPWQEESYTEISFKRAAIDFQQTLNSNARARIRLNFTTWLQPETLETVAEENIEYSYLELNMSSSFSLKFGKIFIPSGSWENDYNVMDQYLYSWANQKLPVIYGAGLDLRAFTGEQTWSVQLLNSPLRHQEQKTTAVGANLAWYGHFQNNSLEPIISYGRFPAPQQTQMLEGHLLSTGAFDTSQIGIGFRWTSISLQTELEYGQVLTSEYQKELLVNQQIQTLTQDPEKTWSMLVFFKYHRQDYLHWVFKYTSDETLYGDGDSMFHTGEMTGVEIYPENSQALRIHLIYLLEIVKTGLSVNQEHRELNLGITFKVP